MGRFFKKMAIELGGQDIFKEPTTVADLLEEARKQNNTDFIRALERLPLDMVLQSGQPIPGFKKASGQFRVWQDGEVILDGVGLYEIADQLSYEEDTIDYLSDLVVGLALGETVQVSEGFGGDVYVERIDRSGPGDIPVGAR